MKYNIIKPSLKVIPIHDLPLGTWAIVADNSRHHGRLGFRTQDKFIMLSDGHTQPGDFFDRTSITLVQPIPKGTVLEMTI